MSTFLIKKKTVRIYTRYIILTDKCNYDIHSTPNLKKNKPQCYLYNYNYTSFNSCCYLHALYIETNRNFIRAKVDSRVDERLKKLSDIPINWHATINSDSTHYSVPIPIFLYLLPINTVARKVQTSL